MGMRENDLMHDLTEWHSGNTWWKHNSTHSESPITTELTPEGGSIDKVAMPAISQIPSEYNGVYTNQCHR